MAKRKTNQTNNKNKPIRRTITKKPSTLRKTQVGILEPQKKRQLISVLKIRNSFFAFLAIAGFSFGIYNFYPHISIQETTLLQSNDPFYYPFVINNTGNIKVKNFVLSLNLDEVRLQNGTLYKDVLVSNSFEVIPQIRSKGSHPINLINRVVYFPPGQIKTAKIFINYKYSIPILGIQFSDSTKFVLFKDSFNAYKWKEYQY
jgi:hypothetical protein